MSTWLTGTAGHRQADSHLRVDGDSRMIFVLGYSKFPANEVKPWRVRPLVAKPDPQPQVRLEPVSRHCSRC